jgi:hypothetical protein
MTLFNSDQNDERSVATEDQWLFCRWLYKKYLRLFVFFVPLRLGVKRRFELSKSSVKESFSALSPPFRGTGEKRGYICGRIKILW